MRAHSFMKLEELTRLYSPVAAPAGGWPQMVEELYRYEPRLMEELQAAYRLRGFDEPITLVTEEDEETGEQLSFVANGTHRTALALTLGLKEVPVEFGYSDELLEPGYESEVTQLSGPEFTEAEEDEIFSSVRSWPYSDTIWAHSDGMSSSEGSWWFTWCFREEISLAELDQKLMRRMEMLYPTRTFAVESRQFSWDD